MAWYGTGERLPFPDPREIKYFENAKLVLLPAVFLKACHVLSSMGGTSTVHLLSHRMSLLMVLELACKLACYSTMAHTAGGIVHVNQRAFGPQRGCYTSRYIQWSIGVPIMLAINNSPLMGMHTLHHLAKRMGPNILVTWAYIVASWVGQVTPNAVAGWCLIALAFAAYAFASFEQVSIILESRSGVVHPAALKIGLVVAKEVLFAAFGMVYMMGIFDVLSSLSEQMFYTYSEVMFKFMHSSTLVVIRNWEELAATQASHKEDMSQLISTANAPILSMSVDGHITGWNEHLACLSGIKAPEAIGERLVDLVPPECRIPLLAALESCRQGRVAHAVEVSLSPLGSIAEEREPTQMLMSLVKQLGGDASTIVAIGQDLTELAAMKEMQARRAIFTATVGHELRSPLHGIMGLSGAMAESSSNGTQKRQLTMIRGCATRLLDLVTNIMDMAKTEKDLAQGQAQAAPTGEVNIMDIVEEVVGMSCAAVDKSGRPLISPLVKIVNNMRSGTLPMIKGNPYKCTQVFYNLLTNACKFTKQGTVTFNCRHDEAGSALEIDVVDTGEGIAPASLGRIFEPFEQEDKKGACTFQGIGLGLSVVKGILKLHGGSISVQSTVGQGSTFTVRLPCDNAMPVGLTSLPSPEEDEEVAMTHCADRKLGEKGAKPLVLSVDDDEVNQEVIERTLGSKYRIVRAMNGTEALQYLTTGNELPHVVLLDIMMPGLTGFEVCNQIRTKLSLGHQALPVVMISARAPVEDTALESFRCGATDHMQKPFSARMIKARLDVIADLRHELGTMTAQRTSGDEHPACEEKENLRIAPPHECKPENSPEVLRLVMAQRNELEAKVAEQERAAAQGKEAQRRLVKENAQLKALIEAHVKGGWSAALLEGLRGDKNSIVHTPPRVIGAFSEPDPSKGEALRRALSERDALRTRLEAQELAATQEREALRRLAMQPEVSKGHVRGESSWEDGQLAPAAAARLLPPPSRSAIPLALVQSELEQAKWENNFLAGELKERDGQIEQLARKLQQRKGEAWLQSRRAEAAERELGHARLGLSMASLSQKQLA